MSEIELRQMPAFRVAAVAHRGAYRGIGVAFEQLGVALEASGSDGVAGGWMGVYHDNPLVTPEPALRSHAAAIWAAVGPVPEGLQEVNIPAGRYAVLIHSGPYAGLSATWASFTADLIAAVGATARDGASLEIYLNDPDHTAAEDLRTELCMPVE